MTGQVSSRQAAMAPSSARRRGAPGPGRSSQSGAAHPARPGCSPPRTGRGPARRSGAASSTDPANPRRPGPHPASPAGPGSARSGPRRPLGGQRLLPASCQRPPHRFAGILDARKRFAISRSLAPSSISSAAASRTRSRRPVLRRSARRHRGTSWFRHSARCATSPEAADHRRDRVFEPGRAAGQVTDTVIFPPARPDSITLCASTMSSKPNTLAGLAW
jgi:hypothetical protein